MMFIWTISDAIGLVVTVLLFLIAGLIWLESSIMQWRCKHDGNVSETSACAAICGKCGKNLGFIGTWRRNDAASSPIKGRE